MVSRTRLAALLLLVFAVVGYLWQSSGERAPDGAGPVHLEGLPGSLVKNISVMPASFNPSLGQVGTVTVDLEAAADVSLVVLGPNGEVARSLLEASPLEEGVHRIAWDGMDSWGNAVPDEAYSFRVEAAAGDLIEVADPRVWSGGEKMNPSSISFRSSDRAIDYVLPHPGRVLVRAGLYKGPMMTTITNWEVRGQGACREHWLGADQGGVQTFIDDPEAMVVVQAWSLPEHPLIAFGNTDATYRSWYEQLPEDVEHYPVSVRSVPIPEIVSPHWCEPVHLNKDPEIVLEGEYGAALDPRRALEVGQDGITLRVSIADDGIAAYIADMRFEIVAYLGTERVAEAEEARMPFNWHWVPVDIEPGEYWLNINLVTFRQHVGFASQRVRVLDQSADGTR